MDGVAARMQSFHGYGRGQGLAVVISIGHFLPGVADDRRAACKDRQEAEKTFASLGFFVLSWSDLTADKILETANKGEPA